MKTKKKRQSTKKKRKRETQNNPIQTKILHHPSMYPCVYLRFGYSFFVVRCSCMGHTFLILILFVLDVVEGFEKDLGEGES